MRTFRFTADSTVEFHADSSIHPIHGASDAARGAAVVRVDDGSIAIDPPPTAHLEMALKDLRSGRRIQDLEMLRRVEASRYPTIRWDLLTASGGPERFVVTGKLTFHGVTREVTEQVTARVSDDRLYVNGEHTFDVRDFGVQPPAFLGLKVHPNVRVVARLVGAPE